MELPKCHRRLGAAPSCRFSWVRGFEWVVCESGRCWHMELVVLWPHCSLQGSILRQGLATDLHISIAKCHRRWPVMELDGDGEVLTPASSSSLDSSLTPARASSLAETRACSLVFSAQVPGGSWMYWPLGSGYPSIRAAAGLQPPFPQGKPP